MRMQDRKLSIEILKHFENAKKYKIEKGLNFFKIKFELMNENEPDSIIYLLSKEIYEKYLINYFE